MYKLFVILCLWSTLSISQTCEQNQVKLQVLGSGGPELNDGRVSSSLECHIIYPFTC